LVGIESQRAIARLQIRTRFGVITPLRGVVAANKICRDVGTQPLCPATTTQTASHGQAWIFLLRILFQRTPAVSRAIAVFQRDVISVIGND